MTETNPAYDVEKIPKKPEKQPGRRPGRPSNSKTLRKRYRLYNKETDTFKDYCTYEEICEDINIAKPTIIKYFNPENKKICKKFKMYEFITLTNLKRKDIMIIAGTIIKPDN